MLALIPPQLLPWLVLLFGLSTTGAQFFCLHKDNALHVDFGQNLTSTYTIPLMVTRFVTMFHVMMGFAIFWSVPVCIMFMAGHSMIEYQGGFDFGLVLLHIIEFRFLGIGGFTFWFIG